MGTNWMFKGGMGMGRGVGPPGGGGPLGCHAGGGTNGGGTHWTSWGGNHLDLRRGPGGGRGRAEQTGFTRRMEPEPTKC